MQKLFTAVACCFVALLLTTIAIAQEIETSPTPSASPSPTPTVEYILPYPGLLPDHPLYPIKVMRDRILGAMIGTSVKRIEFHMLMADKRLQMGIFLSEKGKERLAEQTVAKGEKYLFAASEQMAVLKPRQEGLDGLLDRLKKSIIKHEEVVTALKTKAAVEYQPGYETSLTVVQQAEDKLHDIK